MNRRAEEGPGEDRADTDFVHAVDRRGTSATKWERYTDRDVLPFWVADMEFPAPAAVLDALRARVDHGVLGYTNVPASLVETLRAFLTERYRWEVPAEWIVWIPGVVPGLNLACRAVGEPGDAVVTATPIYYPFLSAPGNAEREKRETRLLRRGARWEMDFDDVAAKLSGAARLFMLCNPQNPTGRVYETAELEALADACLREDAVVLSDEIHAELVLDPDRRHVPIATLSPEIAARSITLVAATKTFNIPGVSCAAAIIPDRDLRRRFRAAGRGLLSGVGPLGYAASEAAWRHGEPWRQRLLARLRANEAQLRGFVDETPGLSMTPVEATCLAWIDCSERFADAAPTAPHEFFEAAGVGPSPGPQFGGDGDAGDHFVRFNFGCSEAMLTEGIERMRRALEAR